MTFEDLELFWALAERQSITDAAEAMRMSQPTASRRLKAMEEELGAPLLDRGSHPLGLTPFGFLFLDFSDEVLQKYRALKLNAGANQSMIGTLTVATSSSPAARLVTRWMADFVKANPGIQLRLAEMNSQDVERHVLEHEMDLGFMGTSPADASVTSLPIADDHIVLIAPRQGAFLHLPRPTPWDLVRPLPFVMRTPGSGTDTEVRRALRAQQLLEPSHVVLEVDTGTALIDAVESGLGAGFVSHELLFRRDLLRSTILPVRHLMISRPFYLVFRGDRIHDQPVARAFLRYANMRFHDLPPPHDDHGH